MDKSWEEIVDARRPAEADDVQKWADREVARERRELEAIAASRIEAASDLISRAIRLLVDADRAWRMVSGVVHSSADETVLDRGRELHHSEQDEPVEEDDEGVDLEDSKEELGQWEVEAHFVAAQPPLRLRLERFRKTGLASEGPGSDLLIVTARQYHVVSGGRVETVRAHPRRILSIPRAGELWSAYEDGVERGRGGNVTYGIENLDTLLRPACLVRAFEFTSASQTIEAGRDAISISAVPAASDDFFFFGRGLVALGPATYTITIDASYGIVLAWSAAIDGVKATGQALRDVEIDRPIDESAFQPQVGPSWTAST